MHQKTPSEPSPRLGSELKKEFAVHLKTIEAVLSRFFLRYRIPVFAAMLICILFSVALAFTVMRVGKVEPMPSLSESTGTAQNDFSEIMQTGKALQEVLNLQNQISTVLQKDSLNATDSITVKNALRRLDTIQHQIKPKSQNK